MIHEDTVYTNFEIISIDDVWTGEMIGWTSITVRVIDENGILRTFSGENTRFQFIKN